MPGKFEPDEEDMDAYSGVSFDLDSAKKVADANVDDPEEKAKLEAWFARASRLKGKGKQSPGGPTSPGAAPGAVPTSGNASTSPANPSAAAAPGAAPAVNSAASSSPVTAAPSDAAAAPTSAAPAAAPSRKPTAEQLIDNAKADQERKVAEAQKAVEAAKTQEERAAANAATIAKMEADRKAQVRSCYKLEGVSRVFWCRRMRQQLPMKTDSTGGLRGV